jgi:hypothetical protein
LCKKYTSFNDDPKECQGKRPYSSAGPFTPFLRELPELSSQVNGLGNTWLVYHAMPVHLQSVLG